MYSGPTPTLPVHNKVGELKCSSICMARQLFLLPMSATSHDLQLNQGSVDTRNICRLKSGQQTNLVGMKFNFDILQYLVSLDAWERLSSLEYTSVQLQHACLSSHAPLLLACNLLSTSIWSFTLCLSRFDVTLL